MPLELDVYSASDDGSRLELNLPSFQRGEADVSTRHPDRVRDLVKGMAPGDILVIHRSK